MTLQKYIEELPNDRQFKVAIRLANLVLPIWDNYATNYKLSYRDSVVGLKHKVDKNILKNAIVEAETYINLSKIKKNIDGKNKLTEILGHFDDPIVALQDTDWELPDEVEKTFYAVYNLIESLYGSEKTVFDDSTIYVSINQAIDALITSKTLTFDEINIILEEIKNGR
jgi:hypothetical protein